MILAVATESSTWFELAVFSVGIVWILVLFAEMCTAAVLILKVYRLVWQIEEANKQAAKDKLDAAEDRRLTRELLTTVKGWAVIMERNDENKEKKIAKVAEDVAQNTQSIKDVIVSTVNVAADSIVDKVVQKVRNGDSHLGEIPCLPDTQSPK